MLSGYDFGGNRAPVVSNELYATIQKEQSIIFKYIITKNLFFKAAQNLTQKIRFIKINSICQCSIVFQAVSNRVAS